MDANVLSARTQHAIDIHWYPLIIFIDYVTYVTDKWEIYRNPQMWEASGENRSGLKLSGSPNSPPQCLQELAQSHQIWGWVKTLSPCSSHQNSWEMDVNNPLKMVCICMYRYWSIAISSDLRLRCSGFVCNARVTTLILTSAKENVGRFTAIYNDWQWLLHDSDPIGQMWCGST